MLSYAILHFGAHFYCAKLSPTNRNKDTQLASKIPHSILATPTPKPLNSPSCSVTVKSLWIANSELSLTQTLRA